MEVELAAPEDCYVGEDCELTVSRTPAPKIASFNITANFFDDNLDIGIYSTFILNSFCIDLFLSSCIYM